MTRAPDGAIVRITYETGLFVEAGDFLLTSTDRGYRILDAQATRRPHCWRLTAIVLGDRARWRKRPPRGRRVHRLVWNSRDPMRMRRGRGKST